VQEDRIVPSETAQLRAPAPKSRMFPAGSRRRRVAIVAGAVLAAFLGWEGLTRIVAYTDDAYVRSDLVALSPEVTGHVIAVHVADNQTVRRGDKLITIDPTPFRLAVDAQIAALREAEAQEAADKESAAAAQDQLAAAAASQLLAEQTQRRSSELERESFASRAQLDTADAGLRRAQADVDSARAGIARAQQMLARDAASIARVEADLATAQWRLSRTELRAPVDGSINNLTVRPGDAARADVPLLGIVDAGAWRIIANYKQDYIRAFRVGGTGWVWLDSHPWHLYRARIQGIARAISRDPAGVALLPYVAPTTDWIRLQRRFPVTLVLTDPPADLPLYMGADARVLVFP
jgi:multidrug efflux system membrane fusion protein